MCTERHKNPHLQTLGQTGAIWGNGKESHHMICAWWCSRVDYMASECSLYYMHWKRKG